MEGTFRPPADPDFRLIETLAFRPESGFVRVGKHLARMERSARALGLPFDAGRAIATLDQVAGSTSLRCRLTMDISGGFGVTTGALADNPSVWRVAVSNTRLAASDIWLQHKTTQRDVYDRARAALPEGVDEWLFLNERDEVCEGTITNIFLDMPDGRCLTPPLSSGLLPGILREDLLENNKVSEAVLTMTDLQSAERFWMGNSLRGLIWAELAVL